MSEIQLFNNPDFGEIRTVTIDGEPWFVGKDVAVALGYSNTQKAIRDHVDNEDKLTERIVLAGQNREVIIINESGLYSLILSSKLPSAKKFKRWVTSEVLPTLRKTGKYAVHERATPQRAVTIDDCLKAASIVATCRNERMPYVLGFLKQGGFDLPHTAEIETNEPVKAVQTMRDIKYRYDLNNVEIGRLIGLDRVQVSRYLNGNCLPKPDRALFIIKLLNAWERENGGRLREVQDEKRY